MTGNFENLIIKDAKLSCPWLHDAQVSRMMNALNQGKERALFVGGCVRDALLGVKGDALDLDVATTAQSEVVIDLLAQMGIKGILVNPRHGTVSVDLAPYKIDITTLRVDVHTDGRRAVVHPTGDWVQDALRRDFTINALYADQQGNLYDPVGGMDDIRHAIVRFIGDVAQRLREDYLRFFRYFRFRSFYDQSKIPIETEKALRNVLPFLNKLSGERIWQELKKAIRGQYALQSFEDLHRFQTFDYLFSADHQPDFPTFKSFCLHEKRLFLPSLPLFRFAALYQKFPEVFRKGVAERLRFTRNEKRIFLTPFFQGSENQAKRYEIWQEMGEEDYEYACILISVQQHSDITCQKKQIDIYKQEAEKWHQNPFPVSGNDLKKYKETGKKLGQSLQKIRTWWLSQQCQPNKSQCLKWFVINRNKTNVETNRGKEYSDNSEED